MHQSLVAVDVWNSKCSWCYVQGRCHQLDDIILRAAFTGFILCDANVCCLLCKADRLSEIFLCHSAKGAEEVYSFTSMEDLMKDRSEIQEKLDDLIAKRTKLQNRIRRATPEQKELLREAKKELTTEITTLRKKLKLLG